jgi:hypothetical protein
MVVVEQKIPAAPAWNIPQEVAKQFQQSGLLSKIKPGQRIALGVGSRGIVNIREIVIATIAALKSTGAEVFIVPSMGSHGGGTPEGQTHVLAEYGITPESTGVRIDARMDARNIGTTPAGTDVFTAEAAMEADGIVFINRIKPHTDFSGSFGSGLMKMCVIGLGKHRGAIAMHSAASRLGYEVCIRAAARVILQRAPVLGGLALIEDQNHQTAVMEVVAAADFETREAVLFQKAKELMPRLPFDEVDLLIVDEMGKDISGSGMDTNVIGRSVQGFTTSLLPPENGSRPHVYRLFVRGLSHASNGNAVGIGLADFATTRCAESVKRGPTYTNSLTALTPSMAKIPIYFDTDRECIERALTSLALPDPSKARVIRIMNTLTLKRMQVSEAYKLDGLEVTGKAIDMTFDEEGNLGVF